MGLKIELSSSCTFLTNIVDKAAPMLFAMPIVPSLCNVQSQRRSHNVCCRWHGAKGTLNFCQRLATLKKLHKLRVLFQIHFIPGGSRAGKQGGGEAGGEVGGRWRRWRPRARPWCSTPTAWSAGSQAQTCCDHLFLIHKLSPHNQHSEH